MDVFVSDMAIGQAVQSETKLHNMTRELLRNRSCPTHAAAAWVASEVTLVFSLRSAMEEYFYDILLIDNQSKLT